MDFGEFQQRFIAHLKEKVRSGELTERGLARITGVSQPHIHNVLKGKRAFSINMADGILAHLDLDLVDLIRPDELLEWRRRR
ncbi:Transcriptional regulator, XRE family [Candidatus Sulfopaludibacter sp. SbA3]|nr:Transcriptional regulator, XRE family [Candidatus Sulfopaludibacter sp. SbA3]